MIQCIKNLKNLKALELRLETAFVIYYLVLREKNIIMLRLNG
nr:MAG TPA: CCSMST1 family protein [Caudoviricetes sp.]